MKYLRLLSLLCCATLLLLGCVSPGASGGGSDPIKLEIEDSVYEGNIELNTNTDNPDQDGDIAEASGDFLYMKDSGTITLEVTVDETRDYIVKIYYALPNSYGEKTNNIWVNGNDLGPHQFPVTGGKWTAKWLQLSLEEGSNSIAISHNWGYTWFDYLTVEKF